MIPVSVFLFLAAVAGALALYSFLERQSWMYSQITAAGLSAALLWVLALMLASGNVGYITSNPPLPPPLFTDIPIPEPSQGIRLLDPTLPYIFALFAVVMTVYFVLHIANWLQDRITNREEEEES